MSWGFSVGPLPYPEIENAIEAATIPENQGEDSPDRQEQLAAAKHAAHTLLVLSSPLDGEQFSAYLNGHSSQNEGWTPAWSVGASITRVQERIPTPEEPKHAAEA